MSDFLRYLRGDPDRPFLTDKVKHESIRKKIVFPTHEPLWFYRNRGTCTPAEKARSIGYKSPENVQLMAELGIHMPDRSEFFKGLGLIRERSHIDRVIAYSKEVHKNGMLMSVYVGGTMFTDYFFKEVPEAVNWARKDMNGQPVTYGGYQLSRWFPCLNNPGYRAYTKKVLDVAVLEVEADEIFFDNQILRYEPRSCRCEHCVKHLRDMIKKKYTLEQCEERYGVAEYPDSVPPVFSQANPPWRLDRVSSPNIQDWIDHRVSTVIEFYKDMAEYVKSKKPATAVGMNIKGVHGHNRAFDHGVSHGDFTDILDFSCIDGYKPGYFDGAISSEFRFYKSSHSTHISVVDGNDTEIQAAEGQVLGYKKKIEGHGWLGDIGNNTVLNPTTQFVRSNLRLYHERQHVTDIAVLRYEPAMNYNNAKTHEQIMAFEQTLFAEKLPWGIIYDKQRESISKHRIIALPEVQALSDKWLDSLDAFMKNGGSVIASGGAAGFNEWMRSRNPAHALERWLGHAPKKIYERTQVGKGTFVYVPEWDVVQKWDFKDWCSIWPKVFPVKNRAEFLRAIDDASNGRPFTHRAEGNDAVLLEGIIPDKNSGFNLDLHFINYNPVNIAPVITVKVALPEGGKAAKGELISVDEEGSPKKTISSVTAGSEAVFNVQTPRVYSVLRIAFIK
jgi:hypothetical protein